MSDNNAVTLYDRAFDRDSCGFGLIANLDDKASHWVVETAIKSLARLTDLRRLDLGHNDLHEVPEVVGSLPELRELWLDGNKIKRISDLVGNLDRLEHAQE